MANVILSAELSGTRKILLTWTFLGSADFEVFWKSSSPPGQEYALLGSTSSLSYLTPELDSSKTYFFYVKANSRTSFFYSEVVELFVSCGQGMILSSDPPNPPPDQFALLVTDTGNNRLVKLTKTFEWGVTSGSQGSGPNQFNTPGHSCVTRGYVYTCDTGNNRVVKSEFMNLQYVDEVGSLGTGDNNFNAPYGIATDGFHIYVADSGNHRVMKFDLDLNYVAQACHYGSLAYWARIYEWGTIHVGDPVVPIMWDTVLSQWGQEIIGGFVGGYYRRSFLYGANSDGFAQNVAWMFSSSPTGPWQVYQGYGGDPAVVAGYAYGWALFGTAYTNGPTPQGGIIHLNSPTGICCDGTYIYVVDKMNNSFVQRLCSDLSWVSRTAIGATANGHQGIAVGNGYICTTGQPYADTYWQVSKYTHPAQVFVIRMYSAQSCGTPAQFYRPDGIWIHQGIVYIIEAGCQRIQKYNVSDFSFITAFGSGGSGVNQFSVPRGITGVYY